MRKKFFLFCLTLNYLQLVKFISKNNNYNVFCGAIKTLPLWINSTTKAIQSGIDVVKIYQKFCEAGEVCIIFELFIENMF